MIEPTDFPRPWSMQVSLVEGCNRLCTFCGLNALRTKPGGYKYMSDDVAHAAAAGLAELNPVARVEFAMHGEPTMHPDFMGMIRLFRMYLPRAQLMLTTNGRAWMRRLPERLDEGFRAGLDFVLLDTYEPERQRVIDAARAVPRSIARIFDYYADDDCPNPYANHRGKVQRAVLLMGDIGMEQGAEKGRVQRRLLNHAGNSSATDLRCPTVPEPLAKTCTNPFREVTVCHDGDVNICCMDWGHDYVCGTLPADRLKDVWRGAAFMAARRRLQAKDRAFSPCDRCNKGSGTRVGLLPKVGPPRPGDDDAIRGAQAGPDRNNLPRRGP